MKYANTQHLKVCIKRRFEFALREKSLFFKNDSCLSNCLPVFTQKVVDNGKLKVKLSFWFCRGGFSSE